MKTERLSETSKMTTRHFHCRAGHGIEIFIVTALIIASTVFALTACGIPNIEVLDESTPILIRDNKYPRETTAIELTGLDLTDEDIKDIGKLTQLKTLTLWGNSVTDASVLEPLVNLEYLDLFNNSITDITPLANLTELTYLDISWNPIDDLAPLYTLTNLKTLEISEGDWTESERENLEAALSECEIIWEK